MLAHIFNITKHPNLQVIKYKIIHWTYITQYRKCKMELSDLNICSQGTLAATDTYACTMGLHTSSALLGISHTGTHILAAESLFPQLSASLMTSLKLWQNPNSDNSNRDHIYFIYFSDAVVQCAHGTVRFRAMFTDTVRIQYTVVETSSFPFDDKVHY